MKRRSSPHKSSISRTNKPASGQFRIIAGTHRSRKLTFPAVDGLRPTPDRSKETLFNWIFTHVESAKCLDLFAGSGNLGIEALSRGAANCQFFEKNTAAVESINQHLGTLNYPSSRAVKAELPASLNILSGDNGHGFDLIFIDPPYALVSGGIIEQCLSQLEQLGLINNNALIYVENASHDAALQLNAFNLCLLKEKNFGQVRGALFQKDKLR